MEGLGQISDRKREHMADTMGIGVIGTGYVGLVTGICFAHLGHDVTCVDKDRSKIDALTEGHAPIFEPGVAPMLRGALDAGRLRFASDLDAACAEEVIFIAVGTPPRDDGSSDLSSVCEVASGIGSAIGRQRDGVRRVVVNKSTVPVGSGNWVEMLVREGLKRQVGRRRWREEFADDSSRGRRFVVASNPEFLREGSAVSDMLYPDRVVIGAKDRHAVRALRHVYQPILTQRFTAPEDAPRPAGVRSVPLVVTDVASAETIKYAANAFLATKISFANEIANICEYVGADVHEVMRGIGLDRRIGTGFLNAGIGWGGSCFGKDLAALIHVAREYGYEPELLCAAVAVNERQRRVVIAKLQHALKIIKGRTIGLLGLAFKPNTDDLRDAPSITIAESLLAMGARVKVYDPVANDACSRQHPELDVIYSRSAEELAAGCDAVVLVTEWDELRHLDLARIADLMTGDVFIDGRNALDPEALAAAGLKWEMVGR